MTTFHSVQHSGGPLDCGQAVISAITGLSTADLRPSIKEAYPHPDDFGLPFWVVEKTCGAHGYRFQALDFTGKLADLKPYCLSVVDPGDGHYVLTHEGRLVDSGNGSPVPLEQTRFKDSDVRECWSITHIPRNP